MESWDEVLKKIINKYSEDINHKGFSPSISFTKVTKEMGFVPKLNTPSYVSLDFWSSVNPSQEKSIRSKNLYILRTGRGKFSIIDGNKFPKPYLSLDVSSCTKLESSREEKLLALEDAMQQSQENIGLEQLHYFGIYQKIIENVCGKSNYHIGPRGGTRSSFDVFAKDINGAIEKIFHFDGSEELDYTLWTKDTIFMIEAKSTKPGKGLDIGWHKIIYPATRFRKYIEKSRYRIIPAYLLRWENVFHVFLFPELGFHESGVIINEPANMTPEYSFKIEIFCN